jgi:hypothetical protein
MTTQTDVNSTHLSAAGTIFNGPTRFKGIIVAPAVSTTATFELRDGGSSGRILFQMDVPSNSNPNSYYCMVPGEGIRYSTNIYFTLSVGSIAGVTVFYG